MLTEIDVTSVPWEEPEDLHGGNLPILIHLGAMGGLIEALRRAPRHDEIELEEIGPTAPAATTAPDSLPPSPPGDPSAKGASSPAPAAASSANGAANGETAPHDPHGAAAEPGMSPGLASHDPHRPHGTARVRTFPAGSPFGRGVRVHVQRVAGSPLAVEPVPDHNVIPLPLDRAGSTPDPGTGNQEPPPPSGGPARPSARDQLRKFALKGLKHE